MGADPTYLLYLAYGSRKELRRNDLEPGCAGATLSDFAASELPRKPPLHTRGISRARSFDLEVTPWAPTRLTSCISHTGPEESFGASTLPPGPARPPSASNFPPNRPASLRCTPAAFPGRGGDALGADPTYLLYLPFRSRGELRRIDFAAWPRTATFRLNLPPEPTRKPPLHTRGISRAKSFDLEVTLWAPTRLTSCISPIGPEESSGAPTWGQTAQARP